LRIILIFLRIVALWGVDTLGLIPPLLGFGLESVLTIGLGVADDAGGDFEGAPPNPGNGFLSLSLFCCSPPGRGFLTGFAVMLSLNEVGGAASLGSPEGRDVLIELLAGGVWPSTRASRLRLGVLSVTMSRLLGVVPGVAEDSNL
jgi:hypothetical protein